MGEGVHPAEAVTGQIDDFGIQGHLPIGFELLAGWATDSIAPGDDEVAVVLNRDTERDAIGEGVTGLEQGPTGEIKGSGGIRSSCEDEQDGWEEQVKDLFSHLKASGKG